MNKNLRESGLSLFELGQSLGLAPPSHGYTIAEKSPEIVTAPGVYFPIKRGRVIPLKPRADGGMVRPKTMIEKMEESIDTPTPNIPLELSRGPYEKGNKGIPYPGGVAREWPGSTPWKKNVPLVSRQTGGTVDPLKEYEDTGINYSLNNMAPTQQGIEATTNTASLQPTPINAGPLPTPQAGGNQLQSPVVSPSQPLTGMAEYEANAARTRGIQPTTPKFGLGNVNPLTAFAPRKFRENRSSSVFGSDQRKAYDTKLKSFNDLIASITGGIPLAPRAKGGITDPSMTEEELKRLKEVFPDTITSHEQPVIGAENLSANIPVPQSPGITQGITDIATGREFPEKRFNELITEKERVQTPATEVVKKESQSLSDFNPEILPSGETKYTLPGTEGTAMVGPERRFMGTQEILPGQRQYPASEDRTVSGDELARQRISGNIAAQRKAWEKELTPAPRSYYDAHPEEKLADEEAERIRQENKPIMDIYMKLIEEAKNRASGFGLMGMTKRRAREVQAASIAELPQLTAGLEKLRMAPEKGGQITPHLVQTATGEYVYSYPPRGVRPPGVIPAGIQGKMTKEPSTRLQNVQEDKGDMYRRGTFNPESGENVWGEWQKKGVTPSTDISAEKADLRAKMQLRQQFNNLQPVKDYRDIVSRHSAMQEAVDEAKKTKNFVAVDQAIITLFNKMTDPQSVVRESEYARTPSDMGIVNKVKGKVSKILSGGAGLTDDERNALLSMAERFKSAYEKTYRGYEKEYRDYATMNKWNPDEVIKETEQVTPRLPGETMTEYDKRIGVK